MRKGNTEAERSGGLSEQLPDLSMNVAKEVHVGSSAVQAFILHQELTEQHLWFVLLPHDLELRRMGGVGSKQWVICLQFKCR